MGHRLEVSKSIERRLFKLHCYRQGCTQGGVGVNPPWAWYFTTTLL